MAIQVSLPVTFNNTYERAYVFPELVQHILYHEMKLKVIMISLSQNGEIIVSLRTSEEGAGVEKFIKILLKFKFQL